MVMIESINFWADAAKKAGAELVLDKIQAVVEAAAPACPPAGPAVIWTHNEPEVRPHVYLDDRDVQRCVRSLTLRNLRICSIAKVIGVRTADPVTILFSQRGLLAFNGPLPELPSRPGHRWRGSAEKLELPDSGEIIIDNENGIFGRAEEGAAKRIWFGLEDCRAVMRSMEVRNTPEGERIMPLCSEYTTLHAGTVRKCESPCEVRIDFDKQHGAFATEIFSRPTSVLLANQMLEEVVEIQHGPVPGTTIVKTFDRKSALIKICQLDAKPAMQS